jgi:hypothetical protein
VRLAHWRFLPRIADLRVQYQPFRLRGSRSRRSQRRSLFRADRQGMLTAITPVALHCPDVTDLQLRLTCAWAGAGTASSAATATVTANVRRIVVPSHWVSGRYGESW